MMNVWRSHDVCVEGGGHMMSVCGGWRSHDECVEVT